MQWLCWVVSVLSRGLVPVQWVLCGSLCLGQACEEVMNLARSVLFLVSIHIICFSLGPWCWQFLQDVEIKGQLSCQPGLGELVANMCYKESTLGTWSCPPTDITSGPCCLPEKLSSTWALSETCYWVGKASSCSVWVIYFQHPLLLCWPLLPR